MIATSGHSASSRAASRKQSCGKNVNTETTAQGEMTQPYLRYDGIGVDDEDDLPHTNSFGIMRPRPEAPAAFLKDFLNCNAKRLFLDLLATIVGCRRIRNRGLLRAL